MDAVVAPRFLRLLSACEELGVRFEGKIQVRNLVPLENALYFCVYKYRLPELLPAHRFEVTTNDDRHRYLKCRA